ncbi:MAG: DedA family protein [Candidatus Moranbacteria bacterium]|nr:DedA family protein [Candidatus Moranbacteria bacterium]
MPDISSQEFIRLLPYWGYPLMFLMMTLEGPIVTIIAAFLASMGYFNIFLVFALSVTGDVVGDIILYFIGYFGGARILAKAEKFLKISATVVEKLKAKFHQNSGRIIFYVKSTTGLGYITFILAGTLKINFSKFVRSSIFGGLVWSSFLVVMGYFFGYAAERISQYIKYAGVIIFAGAVVFFIGLSLYKKRQGKEILE